MQCKVEGCEREADYKAAQLCQMHYFRQWRYGTTDTVRRGKAKPRQENPQGYQWVYLPGHPLCHKNGRYVAEHRAVLFEAIGPGSMKCDLCGCDLTWDTCKVDHIDCDVRNNARENLRPTCNTCNTQRGVGPAADWLRTHAIEFAGEVKTAHEWSRDQRVQVASHTILGRIRKGMSPEQALFAPKRTHTSKPAKKPNPTRRELEAQRPENQ
jgi:hypothetical protein